MVICINLHIFISFATCSFTAWFCKISWLEVTKFRSIWNIKSIMFIWMAVIWFSFDSLMLHIMVAKLCPSGTSQRLILHYFINEAYALMSLHYFVFCITKCLFHVKTKIMHLDRVSTAFILIMLWKNTIFSKEFYSYIFTVMLTQRSDEYIKLSVISHDCTSK